MAIIAVPFFAMLLGLMDAGYDLFVQAELDTAVNLAARGVQVGSVTGVKGETSAQLAAAAVCPNLMGLLNCKLLTVGVIHVPTDYYQDQNPLTFTSASSTGGSVCTGNWRAAHAAAGLVYRPDLRGAAHPCLFASLQ